MPRKESVEQSVTREKDGYTDEVLLEEFSVEEKEDIKIVKDNASLVFSPKFIPVYPDMLDKFTPTEVIIYGFIDFYTSNSSSRFYFTNEQIASIAHCSVDTASKSINKLHNSGVLKVSRKMRASGGQIRFISPLRKILSSNYGKSLVATKEKHGTNNNKIKENKIKRETSPKYSTFESITSEVLLEVSDQLMVDYGFVSRKWRSFMDYCLSHGKTYKDYKAALRNAVRKDATEKDRKKTKGSKLPDIEGVGILE